jgi:hypothetical protein
MTRLLIIEDNPELVANLYAFFEPRSTTTTPSCWT